jgi:hypothetical protein
MHSLRFGGSFRVASAAVLVSTLALPVCPAASPVKLAGALLGSVRDSSGIPQMGAVVQLYNRHDRLVEKVLTNAGGDFSFSSLMPDVYSIRVTVASFVPAVKRNIIVQPGMQSVLAINLASVFSSVELVYSSRNPGTLMSDDWKWVLRSSMTSRPVTRMLPGVDISDPNQGQRTVAGIFSDTRGILKVSSGESQSPFTVSGNQPDLGTTFALATSVFGNNHLQFSGNLGYGLSSDLPAAGFRTSFSRADAGGPQVKLTVQQVGMPGRGVMVGAGQSGNAPVLRTMSITMLERLTVSDGLEVDYGASLDSVAYLDRLNYISPFARLTWRIGPGTLDVGYSSGAPPVDLLNAREIDGSLQSDVAAVSLLPRVSLRDGQARVQRSENMEIGYSVQIGSRSYSVGVYNEFVRNGALTLSAPEGFYFAGDLLPELSSRSSVFNIGNYARSGYTASVTQALGEKFSVAVAAGEGGVLTTAGQSLETQDPGELRGMIRRASRHWARGIVTGVVPVIGTRFTSSYEWTDAQALAPGHVFLTQKIYPETGLNFRVRQPIPGWGGLPGRLEATAELRNMLAQGYLPVTARDGRRLVLASFPRAVRGGLAFIF